MHSSSSSPHIGAMVSFAGVALIILGFFLPLLTQSNPQLPPTSAPHNPVSEWEAVTAVSGNPCLFTLLGFLAALPLLGMLIVLGTSIAGLFRVHLPWLVLLKCAAAAWGLAFQLLFDVLVIVIFSIGYARTDIGWGFVVVLIGFIVMLVGTLRLQMIFLLNGGALWLTRRFQKPLPG